jgi:radical S-adenosyl methionine domain-containing protein 2
MKIVAVNYHLYKPCNLRCRFCFATFRDVHGSLAVADVLRLLRLLRDAGCEKLTFAGGEPTLHPRFGEILAEARRLGLVTCVVTNGTRLASILERQASDLDWLGFSIDSAREEVQAALGRGSGAYIRQTLALVDEARRRGVRIKLNTVVTRLTWEEDMSELVRRVRPARWKVFQVLPVAGQNDGAVEDLLIDGDQFRAFVARHRDLEAEALGPIAEDNEAMTDSYAMIDPLGRFYGNSRGRHVTSAPILDVGIETALAQVGFVPERLAGRGGVYAWDSVSRPASFLAPAMLARGRLPRR